MKPCVIAYFPGSGGNRLARYLLQKQWQHNQHAHSHSGPDPTPEINYQDPDTRPYPEESAQLEPRHNLIELTHCLDTQLLFQHFPGRKIIKIKSHFVPSYNRCWQVWTQHLHQPEILEYGLDHVMNMALEHHWQYYNQTRVDWWADQLFCVDTDQDDFSIFMRENLQQYQYTEFATYTQTWQKLKQRNLNFGY